MSTLPSPLSILGISAQLIKSLPHAFVFIPFLGQLALLLPTTCPSFVIFVNFSSHPQPQVLRVYSLDLFTALTVHTPSWVVPSSLIALNSEHTLTAPQ